MSWKVSPLLKIWAAISLPQLRKGKNVFLLRETHSLQMKGWFETNSLVCFRLNVYLQKEAEANILLICCL